MRNRQILIIFVILIILLVASFLFLSIYQKKGNVSIVTDKTEYEKGEALRVDIKNNFRKTICFSSCYPYYLEKQDGKWKSYQYGSCPETNLNDKCINPGQKKTFEISLSYGEEGSHRIAVPVCLNCIEGKEFKEDKRFYSNEFTIKEKVEDETANWETYRNEEYNFSLKFPFSWKGYIAKKRTPNWGNFGTSDSIDFGFLIQESLFNISIHTKTQWNSITSEEGPHPTYIDENDKFVFGYYIAQDAANEEMIERMKEIKDIISTFKFLE